MSIQSLRSLIAASARKYNLNGQLLAASGGKTVSSIVRGWASADKSRRMTQTTQIPIGYLTRFFTAAAVLRLCGQGAIGLDDTLSGYIPMCKNAVKITIRHLITHSSGLADPDTGEHMRLLNGRDESELPLREIKLLEAKTRSDNLSLSAALEYVNTHEPFYEPGKDDDWSDADYILLEAIIEKVTGVSLAQYLEKEFFQPLGMNHTARGASMADCDCCLVFEGETINMGKAEVCDGDRGYVSTAGDLMRFFTAFLEGRLIKRKYRGIFLRCADRRSGAWHIGTESGLIGSEAAVSIDTARKTIALYLSSRTTRILGEEEGFTLMNNVQRHLEDEYARSLDIKLEKLSYENVFSCVRMKVKKEQENFVAKNAVSIAEAYVNPKFAHPFVITDKGLPVGFIMFAHSKGSAHANIWRFMIDRLFQGRGYSRPALQAGLSWLKKRGVKSVNLSEVPGNTVAVHVYKSLGFKTTGEKWGDEIVMACNLQETEKRE